MSADKFETEYHLTPNGWVSGTAYFYGKAEKKIAPPADRVLTVIELLEQSSRFSPTEQSTSEKWRSPDVSDAELVDLQKRFPFPALKSKL